MNAHVKVKVLSLVNMCAATRRVVLFKDRHFVTKSGQNIRRRETTEAAANDL